MLNAVKSFSENVFQTEAEQKEIRLRHLMRELKSVLVAYSGGVDSAYLALIATQELGADALCVLGVSPSLAEVQKQQALDIASAFNFNLRQIETFELAIEEYRANSPQRCFHCKTELYGRLQSVAADENLDFIADGTNADDVSDFRPGRKAAEQKGVRSPLVEVGLTKSEIREMSRRHNLPTWDLPASPCLSSRIAYGSLVSIEKLGKVERGEAFLRKFGLRQFRVRIHDDIVRLEIAPEELEQILQRETLDRIAEKFRNLGFRYVTLDLHGYRTGAMNEILNK